MNFSRSALCLLLVLTLTAASESRESGSDSISSRVVHGQAGDLILTQEVVVDAPVADVWQAYVTAEGWSAWAAPKAAIDFRVGGTIRTHYGQDAKIGDPGTNTLHIVNYVPERVLTLRAELEDNWPEVMKQDDGNLMSVTLFEPMGESRTRIISHGVGYRDVPEYNQLMEFFIKANEGLYQKLKEYLEE